MDKLVFIILLLSNTNLFSQVNFFQTGAIWGYHTDEHPDFPGGAYRTWVEQFEITGDSVINAINYKKLHYHYKETDHSQFGGVMDVYYDYNNEYLRYDSLLNRVYYFIDTPPETLLYDFTLQVGDLIPHLLFQNIYVDSIENTTLFGQTVKKFYITEDTSQSYVDTSQYILEGLGGSNGLTRLQIHGFSISSYVVTTLNCFQLNNNIYPPSPQCDVFAGIEENENKSRVIFSPNPFEKNVKVHIESPFGYSRLLIYNTTGIILFDQLIKDYQELNIFNTDGLYFWKLIYDDNRIETGKIIRVAGDN